MIQFKTQCQWLTKYSTIVRGLHLGPSARVHYLVHFMVRVIPPNSELVHSLISFSAAKCEIPSRP